MSKQNMSNKLAVSVLALSLFGCHSVEENKSKFMQQGEQLFQAGAYKQAQLAFEQALELSPEDNESRYQLAEALNKQGEIVKAFNAYQQVLKQDDKHLMAKIRLGQLLLINGQIAEAEKMAQQVKVQAPKNVEALVFQANLNVLRNNTDAAIVNTEKALKLQPKSASALMMMASIYHKTAKTQQAIDLLQQAVSDQPSNESMHLMLANLYSQAGNKLKAEQHLKQLLELKPASFSPYQRLAAFYLEQNALDKVEKVLYDAVAKLKDNQPAKLYLIDFLAEKRNVDVAMVELLPMIAENEKADALQFKMAALLLKKGQVVDAENTLKQLIANKLSVNSVIQARNILADLYLSNQRLAEAKEQVAEVLKAQADNVDAMMLQGRFKLSAGEVDAAVAIFRQILLIRPDYVQALKLLASAHVINNDSVLAAENMQKVVALESQNVTARQDLLELLMRATQYQQAEQQIAALLKLQSGNKKALESLFKIRLIKKDWPAAQQITQLFLQDEANKALGHYMSGLAYQAEGKLEASIEAFKDSLKVKPDAIEPLTQLIKSYMALDQSKHAVSYLKKLLHSDKDHFVAYKLLGDVYSQQKKWSDASKALSQAIKIKPQWVDVYRQLAQLELLNKHVSNAKKVLRKGMQKTNDAIAIVNDLAAIYHAEGNQTEALALYELAYQKQPTSALVINNLASYLAYTDDSIEGLSRAEKLAEPLEQTTNSQLLDTVAWIAFKQGSYNKAQGILEKVIASSEVSPLIHYHLGMVYFKQGDKALAKNHLDKALSASSDFEGVEQLKKVLENIRKS